MTALKGRSPRAGGRVRADGARGSGGRRTRRRRGPHRFWVRLCFFPSEMSLRCWLCLSFGSHVKVFFDERKSTEQVELESAKKQRRSQTQAGRGGAGRPGLRPAPRLAAGSVFFGFRSLFLHPWSFLSTSF